jgi:hypothetical protein
MSEFETAIGKLSAKSVVGVGAAALRGGGQ